ncbi:MAG: phenylalanine--tRNA ligase subunit beta [Chloroflexota bacterium]
MIKVPLSWLKEYIDITWTPEQLAAGLTLRGLEVESLIRIGAGWDKVVVGQVLSVEKHPNADKLVVLQATDGQQQYQIVTGAWNLQEGDKFPMALPGAKLIDGHKLVDEKAAGKRSGDLLSGDLPYFTVKGGKLRGLDSQAVAVAHLELGISEAFDGIVVLGPVAPVGAPLQEVLGDTILDIDLSPNLGRALSMIGIAREVSAMTGVPYYMPRIAVLEEGPSVAKKIKVEIEATDLCSRFSMMVIEGVKIGPSPEWMQRYLRAADQPVINNIVDITNYVMLELGQPLHAYDYDDIHGKQLIIRRAKAGEKVETIDHVDHTLNPNVLLVADAERGVCLAGVMGGADSEIKDTTVNVALEGANWNAFNIRKTAREMFDKVSEAAKRFERTVDIELTTVAIRRAIQLMQQYAGGRIAKGIVDVYPAPHSHKVLEFPLTEIRRVLGIEIPTKKVVEMLAALEFDVARVRTDGTYQFGQDDNPTIIVVSEEHSLRDGNTLMVRVPSYRNDVTIVADLVEEVARMYGYDKIPESPLRGELPPQFTNYAILVDEQVRTILTGCGLSEVITYTIGSLDDLKKLHRAVSGADAPSLHWSNPNQLMKLANPLSTEYEYMRPTLISSMLKTLSENRRFIEQVEIFEIGQVYLKREGELLPEERRTLALAITGPRLPLSRYNPNLKEAERLDFFDLKGVVEELLRRLDIPAKQITYEPLTPSDSPLLHPGRAAGVYLRQNGQKLKLGVVGEVHPLVVEAFDLPAERVAIAELDLAAVPALMQREIYQTVTRLPVTTQDLAVIVDDDTPAGGIQQLIRETGGNLLTDVTLFDLYRGKPIPEGKKSLAYRLTFQPLEKTLTEDEVTKLREKIEKRLTREVGATFRG